MKLKLKLEDYSLISNEWIDQKIQELQNISETRIESFVEGKYVGQLRLLKELKEQLIPSRLLAEKCFDAGRETDDYGYGNANDKHTFLTSEIEL